MTASIWTAPLVDTLRQHADRGLSSSRIAEKIWDEYRIRFSRNAVLGKAYRIGIGIKPPPAQQRPTGDRKRRTPKNLSPCLAFLTPPISVTKPRKRKTAPAPVNDTDIPRRQRKRLVQLTNTTCRWPVGEPGTPGFFFCGAGRADLKGKRPYCPWHGQRAHEPARRRYD